MTPTDKAILLLIKSALGGKVDSLPSDVDWPLLFDMSEQQGVNGLAVDGFNVLRPSLPDNAALEYRKFQFFGGTMQMEQMYAEHEQVIAGLASFYNEHNIRLMILKGYGLSLDWPKPNHRPVGDIDTYNFGKWKVADALVEKELGIKVDRGHHHHTVFSFHGVTVENHYDFVNVYAHRDAPAIEAKLKELAAKDVKIVRIVRKGLEGETKISQNTPNIQNTPNTPNIQNPPNSPNGSSATIYLPSATFNAIFLMRHMGQHFAGERVTLRQLLDWHFFYTKHKDEVDWDMVIPFYKEIGIYEFFEHINHICEWALCTNTNLTNHTNKKDSVDSYNSCSGLNAIEIRILNDILHPEFTACGSGPLFKLKRWYANRWKHRLVYNENLVTMFITLAWSHLRRPEVCRE